MHFNMVSVKVHRHASPAWPFLQMASDFEVCVDQTPVFGAQGRTRTDTPFRARTSKDRVAAITPLAQILAHNLSHCTPCARGIFGRS